MTGIIDDKGYRLNVGIVIAGPDGRVFWGRRVGNRDAWQFPQGGMMPGESPEETLFRAAYAYEQATTWHTRVAPAIKDN